MPGKSYLIKGHIVSASTGQSVAGIKVTLVKLVRKGLAVIPEKVPAESYITDSTGIFLFSVEAGRATYIELDAPGSDGSSFIKVPLDKISQGEIRIEAKLEPNGHARFRWNDEDWVPEWHGFPVTP